MGAFHAGHHALMRAARERCDTVVVSLFVNPAQFNEAADLAAYPRDEARDAAEAAALGRRRPLRAAGRGGLSAGLRHHGARRGPVRRARGRRARARPLRRRVHGGDQAASTSWRPTSRSSARRTPSRSPSCAAWCATSTCPSSSSSSPPCASRTGSRCSSRNVRLTPGERAPRRRPLARPARRRDAVAARRARRRARSSARRARALNGVEPEYLALVDPDSFQPITTVDGRVLVAVAARIGADPPDRQHHRPDGGDPGAGADHLGGAASCRPRPGTTQARHAHQARRDASARRADRDGHRLRPSQRARRRGGRRRRRAGRRLGRQQRARLRGHRAGHRRGAADAGRRRPARPARRRCWSATCPFGSYEASDAQAIGTAHRFVKEAGCDAVKLEGGGAMAERARAIVRAGVPVMGHVGPHPADRDRARRLPRSGPHGRARQARCSTTRSRSRRRAASRSSSRPSRPR